MTIHFLRNQSGSQKTSLRRQSMILSLQ